MAGGATRTNMNRGDQNQNPNLPAGNAPAPAPRSAGTTLASSALDNVIPTIKEPKETDIIMRFKYKQLDPINGEPTYPKLVELRQQLARNGLTIKSSFGGGNHGHLGLVLKPTTYATQSATTLVVPSSKGAYPRF